MPQIVFIFTGLTYRQGPLLNELEYFLDDPIRDLYMISVYVDELWNPIHAAVARETFALKHWGPLSIQSVSEQDNHSSSPKYLAAI